MGIPIISTLERHGGANFAIAKGEDVLGAFVTVPDLAARDAIPTAILRTGQVVRIGSTSSYYEWNGSSWSSFAFDATVTATGFPAPALVATSNIALTGVVTVDGVASNTVTGDVLCTAQTTASQNGYWTPNASGAWTRPSYYDSDADVAAALGQTSGAALGGTLNKGRQYYAALGATLAGSKSWLPVKATPEIFANEAPWNLVDSTADQGATLAALQGYANAVVAATGRGVKIALGPGLYCTSQTLVCGRYVSWRGAGRLATELRAIGTALIDAFVCSERLNVGGLGQQSWSDMRITNFTMTINNPAVRASNAAVGLGVRKRTALPGRQVLECIVAGTTGAQPPIGTLSPVTTQQMVLTGTSNADRQPVVIVRQRGVFGSFQYQVSPDNGATLGTVQTTPASNPDGTYADYVDYAIPSSGTLGVRIAEQGAVTEWEESTTGASFAQPAVNSDVQIQVANIAGRNTTRLSATGHYFVQGSGLYQLVSIDSALLVTGKLITATAGAPSPGGTVDSGAAIGQAWYPTPRIEVIGTPPANNWLLDVATQGTSGTIGKLGVATFKIGSAAKTYLQRARSGPVGEGSLISPTAGAYYDYTDPASGCTVRFHTGVYTSNGTWNYFTPYAVTSMVFGTTVQDGTVTWLVKEGPECVRLLGRGGVEFNDCWLDGGMSGVLMSQTQQVTFHNSTFINVLFACGYGTDGDGRLGEYGGFCNGINYSGNCTFKSQGFGPVYDGGNSYSIEGTANFQSCPWGFAWLSKVAGGSMSGFYVETSAAALLTDVAVGSRRPRPYGLIGFTFSGFFSGAMTGDYSFYVAAKVNRGVRWDGGHFGGAVCGIGGAANCVDSRVDGSRHADSLPLTDTPFALGVSEENGAVVAAVLKVDVPNAQTLANGANDLAPPVYSDVDISGPTGAFSIRSAPAGINGQRVTYRYFGSQQLTLSHEHATPAAATRLLCPDARDVTLPAAPTGGYVEFTLRYRAGSINRHVVEGITTARPTNNVQAGTSYTATLADANRCVDFTSGSAAAWTIPPAADVPYLPGTVLTACQLGAGLVTVTAGSGVTLRLPPGKTAASAGQYSTIAVRLTDTANTWVVLGNLA